MTAKYPAKCLWPQRDFLHPADTAPPAEVGAAVASVWLDGAVGRTADLFPLPVLGIPGLWPENQHVGFYDDSAVFRSRSHPPHTLESSPQSIRTRGP